MIFQSFVIRVRFEFFFGDSLVEGSGSFQVIDDAVDFTVTFIEENLQVLIAFFRVESQGALLLIGGIKCGDFSALEVDLLFVVFKGVREFEILALGFVELSLVIS